MPHLGTLIRNFYKYSLANKTVNYILIQKNWLLGKRIVENELTTRKDDYGNIMYRSSYGKQSDMGWEIDHKHPKSQGGTDNSRNLQAVQWEENRKKSDTYPYKK